MKKVIAIVMVVCLFALSGCGAKKRSASNGTNAAGQSVKKASAAPIPSLQQRRTTALKALSDVALNKAMFTNVGDTAQEVSTRKLYLKDMTGADTGFNEKIIKYQVTHFAVVDMDRDGVPEVVAELCTGPDVSTDLEGYEVLRYCKSGVYGYCFYIRWMSNIAKKGVRTFSWTT
ncbi:MAG: hypothetical protein FWF45_07235 [Coriobacteriia bacterium]|nr:hypothetical protein [Coriobacteriia bacterium]